MQEKEIGGQHYQFGKLNALQQFHVVRRLGPALMVAGISVEMLRTGITVQAEDILAMAGPVIEVIGRMSDADSDYVIFTCLGVVKRKSGNGWADVAAPEVKQLMFQDIELPHMLQLVAEVLRVNLGNFLMEPAGAPT
jgi:hypothetical protein